MNPGAAPWELFASDMNADGTITISDVVLWLEHAYFLPGDSLLWFLDSYLRPVARFLELSAASYGGLFSGVVSGLGWLLILLVVGVVHDRTVRVVQLSTLRAQELRAETLRRIRVARNRWRGKLWL